MRDDATVLVVDDDADVVDTYRAWLSDKYDTRTATDGEAALDRLDEDVDVALLDRRMPGMSGEEVLGEIREGGYGARVSMVTAVEPDFDIIEMGFDAYLVKPVSREALFGTVDDLLERTEYDETVVDYYSLITRKHLLEHEKSDAELDGNSEYADLLERIDEAGRRAHDLSEDISAEDFKAIARDLHRRA